MLFAVLHVFDLRCCEYILGLEFDLKKKMVHEIKSIGKD